MDDIVRCESERQYVCTRTHVGVDHEITYIHPPTQINIHKKYAYTDLVYNGHGLSGARGGDALGVGGLLRGGSDDGPVLYCRKV